MADIPDTIVLKRDRDLVGRRNEIWVRRGLFSLLVLVAILALLDVFGYRAADSSASTAAARLVVHAPPRVRGGLLYQARFRVSARRDLKDAVLVLDSNWVEGMTINGVEPQPQNEESDNGDVRLELGPLRAGRHKLLFMSFQVNPTNVGHRDQDVDLYDGTQHLLRVHRSLTVLP